MKRILIACIGNIFFGDDAFGVEVAQALGQRSLPAEVQLIDFGIRSYDLAYALTDGYEAIILVDATPHGREPGTLYLIEPDLGQLGQTNGTTADAHGLDPVRALQLAESFGGVRGRPFLVGCEPAELVSTDGQFGLSRPVREAVPKAVAMIESLVNHLLHRETEHQPGCVPV